MSSELVLNINDNDTSRYTLTRMVEHAGFKVLESDSGLDGLAIAVKEIPDVILLDIRLPDIDGLEVCRRLKADPRTNRIPIIHITAHALGVDKKVRSLEEGADAYLTFPVDRIYLIAIMRSLIRLNQAEIEREALLDCVQSDKVRLQAALLELQQEKLLREKFVATLTHDLRNPIAAIKISAEMAKRQPESQAPLMSHLQRIIRSADRADRMIQDLLDTNLLRMGQELPMKFQESDLREVSKEAIEDQTLLFGSRFILKACNAIIGKAWDPAALRRVLENLLQNAVKYGALDQPITVSIEERTDKVALAVHNWGNPIPPEEQKDLFEYHSRSKSAMRDNQGGWGIGLALVRGVVNAHQGKVQVESSEEKGTTFLIELPNRNTLSENLSERSF